MTRILPNLVTSLALAALLAGCSPGGTDSPPQMLEAPKDPSVKQEAKDLEASATAVKHTIESPEHLVDKVVSTLKTEGKDASKEHTITFHIAYPGEKWARDGAKQFEASGFTTTVSAPEGDSTQWTLNATTKTVPDADSFKQVMGLMQAQVDELEGEFESWSAKQ